MTNEDKNRQPLNHRNKASEATNGILSEVKAVIHHSTAISYNSAELSQDRHRDAGAQTPLQIR